MITAPVFDALSSVLSSWSPSISSRIQNEQANTQRQASDVSTKTPFCRHEPSRARPQQQPHFATTYAGSVQSTKHRLKKKTAAPPKQHITPRDAHDRYRERLA